MALIQASIMSTCLKRTVPIQVILPADKYVPGVTAEPKPFKTLYLLHGLLGSCTDWTANTSIQRWAEERDLAVVMPSGDNSFYIDLDAKNSNYGEYIGQELVEVTRRMFPLSRRREDTFIAGLSMGGFGAIRNGLKYSETFGYVAGLSSAIHFFENLINGEPKVEVIGEDNVFGDLEVSVATDRNPRVALQDLQAAGRPLPEIYMCCGTEDYLIRANHSFRDYLLARGVPVTFVEGPGIHDWNFWAEYIQKVLAWLPLGDMQAGVHSGNVG